jgi:hypothetical protein
MGIAMRVPGSRDNVMVRGFTNILTGMCTMETGSLIRKKVRVYFRWQQVIVTKANGQMERRTVQVNLF